MSPRRRGRRHGGGNGAMAASGAEGASGAAESGGAGQIASGATGDGAGRPSGSGDGAPRRPPRVRVQTPPAAPTATAEAALTAAPTPTDESEVRKPACTLAQLRRFIKSRPYVPVHELRRRFLIEGFEDDVSPVATEQGVVYVGLPVEEAQFLADLVKAGEVGCELLLDPTSPAVVGVFAMRPVTRQ